MTIHCISQWNSPPKILSPQSKLEVFKVYSVPVPVTTPVTMPHNCWIFQNMLILAVIISITLSLQNTCFTRVSSMHRNIIYPCILPQNPRASQHSSFSLNKTSRSYVTSVLNWMLSSLISFTSTKVSISCLTYQIFSCLVPQELAVCLLCLLHIFCSLSLWYLHWQNIFPSQTEPLRRHHYHFL